MAKQYFYVGQKVRFHFSSFTVKVREDEGANKQKGSYEGTVESVHRSLRMVRISCPKVDGIVSISWDAIVADKSKETTQAIIAKKEEEKRIKEHNQQPEVIFTNSLDALARKFNKK